MSNRYRPVKQILPHKKVNTKHLNTGTLSVCAALTTLCFDCKRKTIALRIDSVFDIGRTRHWSNTLAIRAKSSREDAHTRFPKHFRRFNHYNNGIHNTYMLANNIPKNKLPGRPTQRADGNHIKNILHSKFMVDGNKTNDIFLLFVFFLFSSLVK